MKTVFMVWYSTPFADGPCFRGRDVFRTEDYNEAEEYKNICEEYCDCEDSKYTLVGLIVPTFKKPLT